MKTFIETQLYAEAAKYKINNVHPVIICGPEARRTDSIARNTGVLGDRGATYVERNTAICTRIRNQLSHQTDVKIINQDIRTTKISRFIDVDITGNSDCEAGSVFKEVLNKQQAAYRSKSKAIIFTFSLRPKTKWGTEYDLSLLIQQILGDTCTFTTTSETNYTREQYWAWRNQARSPHCHDVLAEHTKKRLITIKTYYYNTGGGHMMSGIIIYK